ncbi:hypothetical protein [Gloeobacter violaceus]|uniref:Gsl3384 protein n=1 Tax=Gloeobacter violaceus (strain ATCC 29082 / PCC 7421) TaxID=251221 RepID=Q7NFZ0_GLOVI|nr:hypothetical protein [Gloeobacter violaceus]BAC91325.1 gsl3384 [Gloeobacter violaceus PCC 7421]
MTSGPRSNSNSNPASDESFSWDNERYGAVVEQHTGVMAGMIDKLICLGLLLFGLASLPGVVMMFFMQLQR